MGLNSCNQATSHRATSSWEALARSGPYWWSEAAQGWCLRNHQHFANWKTAIEIIDLPMKNGDLPMKNGDLPMKNGDLPMKNCDLPMKNGDLPMKNGDFP